MWISHVNQAINVVRSVEVGRRGGLCWAASGEGGSGSSWALGGGGASFPPPAGSWWAPSEGTSGDNQQKAPRDSQRGTKAHPAKVGFHQGRVGLYTGIEEG